MNERNPGRIVILNGAPRAGKSSIVRAVQRGFDGSWMNLGVDVYVREITPERYRPGIGLRPGGERPDLEAMVPTFYAALYESIAAHGRLGLDVIAELGHHDAYSRPLHILRDCARRLAGLPVLFVGVRCPLDVVMERRERVQQGRENLYLTGSPDEPFPAPVLAWQREVHRPGLYDLELDTARSSPDECAQAIHDVLEAGLPAPSAFERLASAAPTPGQ